jgi:hypothetical protein
MQKPGATPQEKSQLYSESAEGAEWIRETVFWVRSVHGSVMSRFQRFIPKLPFPPGALPQAITFRALGAEIY